MSERPVILATRGSALALAQANMILAHCRQAAPELEFAIKIFKTTGDKLQTASLASANLPKGLFTKELEVALLNGEADLAVHSLKDLPTELPAGLKLGATPERADVRDVLVYRDANSPQHPATVGTAPRGFAPHLAVADLPAGATIATSSTRRAASLRERRPDLNIVPIRGNVPTRLRKLSEQPAWDALVLAAAGLERLKFELRPDGQLVDATEPPRIPPGLLAVKLPPEEMLPCVGQAAIGLEIRADDARLQTVCDRLNHLPTFQCVTAERALLKAMGGGCQVPVGAHAEIAGREMRLRAVSFLGERVRRAEGRRDPREAVQLGEQVAAALRV